MNGKPCIRGMRITVSIVLNLLASGMSKAEILDDYPYLEPEDIEQCLLYAVSSKKCPINSLANYQPGQQRNYRIISGRAGRNGMCDGR